MTSEQNDVFLSLVREIRSLGRKIDAHHAELIDAIAKVRGDTREILSQDE